MSYLEGLDLSTFQDNTPGLGGLDYGFSRATYNTRPDDMYDQHTANFRKAGLVPGAYHFGVGYAPVAPQVAAFLNAAAPDAILVLDLEHDAAGSMTATQAAAFIAQVLSKGRKIGLYHSASGFPNVGQDFNWVAKWSTTPPSGPWTFWQYTSSGSRPGYSGRLDLDRFNGDIAALRKLAGIPAPVAKSPAALGPKPAAATMWVDTHQLARLFYLGGGVLRPILGKPPAFTFQAWCGPNERRLWAPGPKSTQTALAVFRPILSGSHKGMYVRVSDLGSTWHHL